VLPSFGFWPLLHLKNSVALISVSNFSCGENLKKELAVTDDRFAQNCSESRKSANKKAALKLNSVEM